MFPRKSLYFLCKLRVILRAHTLSANELGEGCSTSSEKHIFQELNRLFLYNIVHLCRHQARLREYSITISVIGQTTHACLDCRSFCVHTIVRDMIENGCGNAYGRGLCIYSSSSSSPPSSRLAAAAARLRLTRPARPPPNGDVREKSMCFWESSRTIKDGTLTICLPTLNTM